MAMRDRLPLGQAVTATPSGHGLGQQRMHPGGPAPVVRLSVQTRLRVSVPGDAAEQEALAVGAAVARMPEPSATTPVPAARGSVAPSVQRRAITLGETPLAVGEELQKGGGGMPLPGAVRSFMDARFGADFGAIRIHTDARAAMLSARLGARAFTLGPDVYFARDEFQPGSMDGRELIAHELTHTIQQGVVPQRSRTDVQPAAAQTGARVPAAPPASQRTVSSPAAMPPARGRPGMPVPASVIAPPAPVRAAVPAPPAPPPVRVAARAPTAVQRFGISDALDKFAEYANVIPGFRMLTIVLGVNPISMSPVDRSAANILRAIVEFIPGGGLIVQALNNSGVFEKAGAWISDQIATLGLVGSAIKKGVDSFLSSLKWSDILDLDGVWQRAKRIFTEPIDRLIAFAKGLLDGILKLIKDAILKPLAQLASQTRAWDLLTAVLGKNPITGEAVPRTAETLIGGFLKLIGKEDVWENMKKANAIPRAWAWFQGAMTAVIAFVSAIPDQFVTALKSLTIEDVVLVAGAFAKVAAVFGSFLAKFIDWAGTALWDLAQIIIESISPGALEYIKKTGAALKSILLNPLPFVGNLVKAAKAGFMNFADHFGTHLKAGLIDWLTGSLPGVYIPKAFELGEIVKFVLSVLGISWANLRAKLVKAIGETAVKTLETGFDIVVTLVREGPGAAWEKIKEHLTNLKDIVIGGITDFVVDMVVQKAIPKLLAMFVPGAGFISAVLSIYDTIMVFVNKLAQIAAAVKAFIDSIVAIAAGEISGAAAKVEGVLANLLSLAINFLAGFLGLGKVADKIMGVIKKVQTVIDHALDKLVEWIVGAARKVGKLLSGAAGTVKGALAGLIGIRKPVVLKSGEQHSLYFEPKGERAVLTLASNPAPFLSFIDRIGNRPALNADKQFARLMIQRIDALEDDTRATNRDHSAEIAGLVDQLTRTAANLLAAFEKHYAKTTPPAFAGLRDGFGRSMRVTLSTDDLRAGSSPSISNAMWQALNQRRRGGGSYYVLGHLLNEKLGGPGNTPENLTPLSRSGNTLHEHVERIVKPVPGDTPRAFVYVVTPSYGRTVNSSLLAAINASANADSAAVKAKKVSVVQAEVAVPTSISCSIKELDQGDGTPLVDETYSVDNSIESSTPSDYEVS
jgi:hypothetical protein